MQQLRSPHLMGDWGISGVRWPVVASVCSGWPGMRRIRAACRGNGRPRCAAARLGKGSGDNNNHDTIRLAYSYELPSSGGKRDWFCCWRCVWSWVGWAGSRLVKVISLMGPS